MSDKPTTPTTTDPDTAAAVQRLRAKLAATIDKPYQQMLTLASARIALSTGQELTGRQRDAFDAQPDDDQQSMLLASYVSIVRSGGTPCASQLAALAVADPAERYYVERALARGPDGPDAYTATALDVATAMWPATGKPSDHLAIHLIAGAMTALTERAPDTDPRLTARVADLPADLDATRAEYWIRIRGARQPLRDWLDAHRDDAE